MAILAGAFYKVKGDASRTAPVTTTIQSSQEYVNSASNNFLQAKQGFTDGAGHAIRAVADTGKSAVSAVSAETQAVGSAATGLANEVIEVGSETAETLTQSAPRTVELNPLHLVMPEGVVGSKNED